MAVEVRYRANRGDVWRHYASLWRRRLWALHALAIFMVTCTAVLVTSALRAPVNQGVVAGLGAGLLACLAMALYPQLVFKPQERWLRVSDGGVDTTIGPITGHRDWSEITEVRVQRGAICLEVRGANAFIIPARAFASLAEHQRFLESATAWRHAAT